MNDETNDKIVDIVQQKKKKRPDLSEMFSTHTEPGDISRMLTQAMTISHWPPIDSDDANQVSERIDQYHLYCIQNDIKPDMSGLSLALGVSRKTVWAWENGVDSNKSQAVRNVLKKGRQINEYLMSQLMQTGKVNPVVGIFLLKNSHEFRDQQDIVVTPNNPLANEDPSGIRNKYLQALPESEQSE